MTTAQEWMQPERASSVGSELAEASHALVARMIETASLEQGVSDRVQIAEAQARVKAFFEPLKSMAFKLHKALCMREHEVLDPLIKLDDMKRKAITALKTQADRARREAERDEAEQRHREYLAHVEAEAVALEQAGHMGTAAQVRGEAATMPLPVVVLPDATKAVAGLRFKRRYLWRYRDEDRARAELPREFLRIDERSISVYANERRGTGSLPGIEFYYVDEPIR